MVNSKDTYVFFGWLTITHDTPREVHFWYRAEKERERKNKENREKKPLIYINMGTKHDSRWYYSHIFFRVAEIAISKKDRPGTPNNCPHVSLFFCYSGMLFFFINNRKTWAGTVHVFGSRFWLKLFLKLCFFTFLFFCCNLIFSQQSRLSNECHTFKLPIGKISQFRIPDSRTLFHVAKSKTKKLSLKKPRKP